MAVDPDGLTRRFLTLIADHPLADTVAETVLERAVMIRDSAARCGRSHLGGLPLLPPGTAWPRDRPENRYHSSNTDLPLSLLAQIFLDELPAFAGREALPAGGVLQAWQPMDEFAGDDGEAGLILWHPDADALAGATPPADLPLAYRFCPVRFEARLSLMAYDHLVDAGLLPAGERERFIPQLTRLEALAVGLAMGEELPLEPDGSFARAAFAPRFAADTPHALLGHPSTLQDRPELDPEWCLLLQLDSDDDADGPGWMWGDCGKLWFRIRRADLAAGRFAAARAWWACC